MRNTLDQETSPYLLQHRTNPVHWQAWGPKSLALAKTKNKPILLSVGYAACHWCHVMAHESFENSEIASLMNDYFINIKVDREERPDIDSIYQAALSLMGQHGGWPLTMFLDSSGQPFWGGTYFPPEARLGQPGFAEVLEHISNIYHNEHSKILENTALLSDALTKLSNPSSSAGRNFKLTFQLIDRMANKIKDQVDMKDGGLNGAPKFPQPAIFQLLWRAHLRTGDTGYLNAVSVTLDRMCQGGIYDHLGGGYARYATDSRWLIPHFEKMLYDNALLLDLLCSVWKKTQEPLYAIRIRETIDWVEREMLTDEGAFASSIDADSEGAEGAFYAWSASEIGELLGPDTAEFNEIYDVSPQGNWEGKTILNRLGKRNDLGKSLEAKLECCRNTLWIAREKRPRPGWDDKILTDWNGLMIAALINAGLIFEEPKWIEVAQRAYNFITDHMMDGNRLLHSYRRGKSKHQGVLDDYANMARASVLLFEAKGDPQVWEHAQRFIHTVDKLFWDQVNGGYFYTAADAEALIVRTRSAADSAIPSGNGTMLSVLASLYYLTGEHSHFIRGNEILNSFAGDLTHNFPSYATLINAFEFLANGIQIVILGNRNDRTVKAMLKTSFSSPILDQVLQVVDDASELPPGHPAANMTQVEGQATAYVCHGQRCSVPLITPEDLRHALLRSSGP